MGEHASLPKPNSFLSSIWSIYKFVENESNIYLRFFFDYLDPLNLGISSIDGISNSGINIVHDSYEDIPFDSQNSLSFLANITSYSGVVDGVELHYNLGDGWLVQSM